MIDRAALKNLAARVAGLQQAMKVTMEGTTPDHGKWGGVNSFLRSYRDLARQYASLTGDKTVHIYKTDTPVKLWPQQKAWFDTIYADILMLSGALTAQTDTMPTGPLYNLLVSGMDTQWAGEPFQIDLSRCLREYTDPQLTRTYGGLDNDSIVALKRAPCIFAYETGHKQPPKFGYMKEIVHRQGHVRIEYELHEVQPFLTEHDLEQMTFELDIGKLELYRTHWAVKAVNLAKELHTKNILLLRQCGTLQTPSTSQATPSMSRCHFRVKPGRLSSR